MIYFQIFTSFGYKNLKNSDDIKSLIITKSLPKSNSFLLIYTMNNNSLCVFYLKNYISFRHTILFTIPT